MPVLTLTILHYTTLSEQTDKYRKEMVHHRDEIDTWKNTPIRRNNI